MMSSTEESALHTLEARLKKILPKQYQESYDDIQPVSMGSAGLKYGSDGKVAWDEIWGSFCDLAMAGGPPHKGSLLEPSSRAEIDAHSERYLEVVDEICRGITMVTGLAASPSTIPGWVQVECTGETMAEWLVRAIVMENVSARWSGKWIELPAGQGYRLDKEIKNVITVIAKTCHYWLDHMWPAQHREIGDLFAKMAAEFELIQPAQVGHDFRTVVHRRLTSKMAETIREMTGFRPADRKYAGWLGVLCPSIRAAIWMMRGMVVSNVLARREGTVLFIAVNPTSDPYGTTVLQSVLRIHRFAIARNVL